MASKWRDLFEKSLEFTQKEHIRLRHNSKSAPKVGDRLKANLGAIPVRLALSILDSVDVSIARSEAVKIEKLDGREALWGRMAIRQSIIEARDNPFSSKQLQNLRDAMLAETDAEVSVEEVEADIFGDEIEIMDRLRLIVDTEGAKIETEGGSFHGPEKPI